MDCTKKYIIVILILRIIIYVFKKKTFTSEKYLKVIIIIIVLNNYFYNIGYKFKFVLNNNHVTKRAFVAFFVILYLYCRYIIWKNELGTQKNNN